MKPANIRKAIRNHMDGAWTKRTIGLVAITALIIALFGLAFERGPTQNISADIVDLDGAGTNSTAAEVIATIEQGTVLSISERRDPSDENPLERSIDDLKEGRVEVVIVFGPNFTADIAAWMVASRSGTAVPPSSVTVYLDGSSPIASAAVKAEIQRGIQTALATKYHVSQPVVMAVDVVYGEGTDMRSYMAPAIAGLLIFILTMIPTIMLRTQERPPENGRFTPGERILASGIVSLICGAALSLTIITILAAFGVRMAGDILVTFVLFALLAWASASLGELLGVALGRHHPAASMAVLPLTLYPAILLGGIVLPLSSLPNYLLPISYLFPLTYTIDGARLSMLNGLGWMECSMQISMIIIYAVVCSGVTWWLETRIAARNGRSGTKHDLSQSL
jgi:ABC-2 type transport system permease protein